MTNTEVMPTDLTFDRLQERASELGAEHGHSVATYVEIEDAVAARKILNGIEDGDPEIMDMQRAPLSGEFADDMTTGRLLEELDVPEDQRENTDLVEALCENYELGYSQGYWDEVQRMAMYQAN
jgi:hypothetical protein